MAGWLFAVCLYHLCGIRIRFKRVCMLGWPVRCGWHAGFAASAGGCDCVHAPVDMFFTMQWAAGCHARHSFLWLLMIVVAVRVTALFSTLFYASSATSSVMVTCVRACACAVRAHDSPLYWVVFYHAFRALSLCSRCPLCGVRVGFVERLWRGISAECLVLSFGS